MLFIKKKNKYKDIVLKNDKKKKKKNWKHEKKQQIFKESCSDTKKNSKSKTCTDRIKKKKWTLHEIFSSLYVEGLQLKLWTCGLHIQEELSA